MKKYICLFFLIFITNVLFAQSFKDISIDSLKNELTKVKDDTSKILILDRLTTVLTASNPTQALRYGREAWALASKIKYDKGKVLSALSSGQIMLNTSDYSEALNKLLEAKYLAEKSQMTKEIVNINLKLALLYTNRKQFKSALEYLSKAKRVRDSLQIPDLDYSLNQTAGYVYKDMGEFQKALGFFKNAYQNLIKRKQLTNYQQPVIISEALFRLLIKETQPWHTFVKVLLFKQNFTKDAFIMV